MDIAHQQLLRGVAATLSVQFRDSTGEPAAPSGTVTVRVQKADGTDVLPAGTATTTPTDTTTRTRALTAAQTATLDLLTATWTDGAGPTVTTLHEIVGGFYFTVTEARTIDPSLADAGKYPPALMLSVRREVEEEFERICGVAFVPRYRRVRLDGTGGFSLRLPDPKLRTVRAVRAYSTATAYTEFTASELAGLAFTEWGTIDSVDASFGCGRQNLVVEYEHGYDGPPAEVKRAAIERLRQRLNLATSGVPANAQSFTAQNGGTYRLARPSRWSTGSDEIDSVLQRFSMRIPGLA